MRILVANLKSGTLEREELSCNKTGLEAGLFLYNQFGEDSLVITAATTESTVLSNASSACFIYYSKVLGHREFSSVCLPFGYSLRVIGFDALVILERAERMRYISLNEESQEIIPCETMRGQSASLFEESSQKQKTDISIATSPASDKGVWYGTVQYKGRSLEALGLGNAFYSHNLKGIVFQSFTREQKVSKKGKREKKHFFRKMRTEGNYTFVDSALRLGYVPVRNFFDRFDPRVYSLDGKSVIEKFGTYPESCGDCFLSCKRRKKEGEPLPDWKTLLTLGPNLDLFELNDIYSLYSATEEEGLDQSVVGSLLSTILSSESEMEKYEIKKGNLDSYVAFIHRLGTGSILYSGLSALEKAYQNYDSRPFDFDPRGAYSTILISSQGIKPFITSTMIFPKRSVKPKLDAIFTYYETMYYLALLTLGYPYLEAFISYFQSVPEIVYHSAFFSRLVLYNFSYQGYSGKELLEIGKRLSEALGLSFHPTPEYFRMNTYSAYGYGAVPMRKLEEYYEREKNLSNITFSSIKERIVSLFSNTKLKVGPKDERGKDGDPGFKK